MQTWIRIRILRKAPYPFSTGKNSGLGTHDSLYIHSEWFLRIRHAVRRFVATPLEIGTSQTDRFTLISRRRVFGMQVAILSDMHVPAQADALPDEFTDRVADADHVVHAGDFGSRAALETVRDLADDLTAVYGNADPIDAPLPSVAAAEVGDVTFVVHHGEVNRSSGRCTTPPRVLSSSATTG